MRRSTALLIAIIGTGALVAWVPVVAGEDRVDRVWKSREGQLIPGTTPPAIYIWKSLSAMDEGHALMRAQADRALLVPLIACLPESGARVVVLHTDSRSVARRVTVIDGRAKGCRGTIDRRDYVPSDFVEPAKGAPKTAPNTYESSPEFKAELKAVQDAYQKALERLEEYNALRDRRPSGGK